MEVNVIPSVMVQRPLVPEEMKELREEFAHYCFVAQDPERPPRAQEWEDVEIFFGEQLSAEQLHQAPRLRWIHVPSPSLGEMPLREIEETSNLLITNSKETRVQQAAEFVMGAALAFCKNLFYWHDQQVDPKTLFSSPYRDLMCKLEDRIHLQIGLGRMGTAVLEMAQCFGMRTWGLQEQASFHPHCLHTYTYDELNALLPAVDLLSIAIPRGEKVPLLLTAHRIDLMKPDSILVIIGSEGILDEDALLNAVKAGKFRGVIIDATLPRKKGGKLSPLYQAREVIVTPEVARLPSEEIRYEYQLFRFNFRRFVYGDFEGMKNLVRHTLD